MRTLAFHPPFRKGIPSACSSDEGTERSGWTTRVLAACATPTVAGDGARTHHPQATLRRFQTVCALNPGEYLREFFCSWNPGPHVCLYSEVLSWRPGRPPPIEHQPALSTLRAVSPFSSGRQVWGAAKEYWEDYFPVLSDAAASVSIGSQRTQSSERPTCTPPPSAQAIRVQGIGKRATHSSVLGPVMETIELDIKLAQAETRNKFPPSTSADHHPPPRS